MLNTCLNIIVENPWPNDHDEESSSTETPTEAELIFIAESVMRNQAANLPEDQTWSPHATRTQFVYRCWCKMGKPSAQKIKKGKHVGVEGPPSMGPIVASPRPHQSAVPMESADEDESNGELEGDEVKGEELKKIESEMSGIDFSIKVLEEKMGQLSGTARQGLEALVLKQLNDREALEAKKKKLLEGSSIPLYSPFTAAKQVKMKSTVDACVSLIRKFALEENLDPVACYRFLLSSGKMRKGSVWDAFQRLRSFERAGMLSNRSTSSSRSLQNREWWEFIHIEAERSTGARGLCRVQAPALRS